MKTVYLISAIILWILIILQIPTMIKNTQLLKQQMKRLQDLDNLHQDCEKVYVEMLEKKAAYQEAKEELLATMAPDLDEATEDDIPPQEEEKPEFLYSHKNGRVEIQAAHCDMKWLAVEIGYLAHRLYCSLYAKEPKAAEIFREYVILAIAGEDSPTWEKEGGYTGDLEMLYSK